MKRSKSTLSKSSSYREIGAFWDAHDLGEFWEQTRPVRLDVSLESETDYYGVDRELSGRLLKLARKRGVSAHTLLNLWLQQKLAATKA
jgi:hypothetical protein